MSTVDVQDGTEVVTPPALGEPAWARALVLAERARMPGPVPATPAGADAQRAGRRLERWRRAHDLDHSGGYVARLAALPGGDGEARLLALLAEPAASVADRAGPPPEWTVTVGRILSAPAGSVPELAPGDPADWQQGSRMSGTTPAERFWSFVAHTAGPAGQEALFAEYPVLARLLVQRAEQGIGAARELFTRWHADRRRVVPNIFGGRDPGQLVSAGFGAGDGHQGNRSVVVLRFAAGQRLVYKPRPLAVHAEFNRLLSWFDSATGGLGGDRSPGTGLRRPGPGRPGAPPRGRHRPVAPARHGLRSAGAGAGRVRATSECRAGRGHRGRPLR